MIDTSNRVSEREPDGQSLLLFSGYWRVYLFYPCWTRQSLQQNCARSGKQVQSGCLLGMVFFSRKARYRDWLITMVTVINLSYGSKRLYSCTPRKAVIAAYAQSLQDFNTWDYAKRYESLVSQSELCVTCGDFSAYLDGRIF